ncbi:MAG TPA: hypothetical protein DCZ75_01060 [Geobacter sp.]|nr:hypothetical protein [Geobacter sp.]
MYGRLNLENSHLKNEMPSGDTSLTAQLAEVKAKLAHTVRSNARRHFSLTPIHIATVLSKHLPSHMQKTIIAEIADDTHYNDIKTITTASGQLFLYSASHISHSEATAKGHMEEVKHVIAQKVRRDSRIATALTPLGAIYALWPDIKPVKICSILNEMQTQNCYRDLKTVAAYSGELYLYCDLHVTEKYAALLARTAVNDACTTIAHVVREESKIYPRPTKASMFCSQVFGIPSNSLQHFIVRVLNGPEFSDIRKLVHPETEEVYLYSNLHLNEEHALSLMNLIEGCA